MVDLPPLLKAALRLRAETDISRLFLPAMSSPNHSPLADHQITPPPELLKSWEDRHFDEEENVDVLLIEAYQAGADQELDACCEYLRRCAAWEPEDVDEFCAARRPKPLSLKKQALDSFEFIGKCHAITGPEWANIRRALEALDD